MKDYESSRLLFSEDISINFVYIQSLKRLQQTTHDKVLRCQQILNKTVIHYVIKCIIWKKMRYFKDFFWKILYSLCTLSETKNVWI